MNLKRMRTNLETFLKEMKPETYKELNAEGSLQNYLNREARSMLETYETIKRQLEPTMKVQAAEAALEFVNQQLKETVTEDDLLEWDKIEGEDEDKSDETEFEIMESTTSLIPPQELWQMIIEMFLWEREHNNPELTSMLEGCGLLDEESEETALFLQTLQNASPEKAIKLLTKEYSLIELSKIYNRLNAKLGDNGLNPEEVKTVEQVLLAVLIMLG
ncbi:MAG: hypothetical protein M0P61_14695 [Ignavibacteriaceae bacterium]|jgi:hypothetical protein|nr:hypothetical protein [Ignavibacteriaceae bacterium]